MHVNLDKTNRWLDKTILVGLLASTFLLPLLFGSISIVLALLLSLAAAFCFYFSGARTRFTWQPTLAALLGGFMLLGVAFAINADTPNDMSFLVSFLSLALPILLYQYLNNLPKPPSFFRIAVYCALGCVLGLLFAHAQRYGLGIGRTVAVSAGSNAVARVAAVLGFLALVGVRPDLRSLSNLVFCAAWVASLLIIILAGSRGALLAVPIMSLVALAVALPQLWRQSKRATVAVLGVIVGVLLIVVYVDPNGFITRFVQTMAELAAGRLPGLSSELRYEMLVGAWNAFWQSPLVGHGWAGHWEALVSNHPTPEIFAPVKQYFSYHNDVADFAVAGGTLGLMAYAIIIAAPIINLAIDPKLRANPRAVYGLVLLPAAYVVFGLTDFVFGFDLLTTLYGFSLAFILSAAKASQVPS